jgi:oxygen-independent coproporphyrinogen-3 oxidase
MVRYLYIHIPFCIRKCIYCDFYSVPDSLHLVNEYVDSICREIELRKNNIDTLDAIYIGGGTPSILKEEHFFQIMAAIKECSLISDNAEITAESNPGTLTDMKIRAMLASGINRLSIGIQSFKDKELTLLGRMHSAEEALGAVSSARRGGFRNLSIDLIYGLPGQTFDSWKDNLKTAVGLHPEHISAYELTPEKETPLFVILEKGELAMPDEEIIAQMYYTTIDTLCENGYEHYEISNFALAGRRCRHNINYWDRGEYVGIGAGAHSFIGGCRTSNIMDIDCYISSMNDYTLAVDEDTVISEKEALKETIFLGLRKTEGFDTRLIPHEPMDKMKKALREMSQQGLVEISGNMLSLTRKGLILCNEVIVRLLLCID